MARVLRHRREPWGTRFTVHGHHIAKLDRFVGQAQRAAARAGREFEGVSIEVDAQGVVSVHAIGMASMLLGATPLAGIPCDDDTRLSATQ